MAEELWWEAEARAGFARAQSHAQEQGQGRRTAPDEVWDQVRADYLAGLSARECCERHGVGRSALRARARDDGWRRTDQPWAASPGLDADDEGVELENQIQGDLSRVDHRQLIHIARRRMMRAVLRNEAAAALRWRRVVVNLELEQDQMESAARYAAIRRARRDASRPADPDSSDSSDSSDHDFETD